MAIVSSVRVAAFTRHGGPFGVLKTLYYCAHKGALVDRHEQQHDFDHSGFVKVKKRLTGHTKRTRSNLAGEAMADFVDRELVLVEGIKRGLDDMNAGRVTSHENAMRRVRATVSAASKTRS